MTSVREALAEDHRAIDELVTELKDAAEGANAATVARVFEALDRRLRGHLANEEEHLFPRLEKEHPHEVAQARAEHELLREGLGALGVDADLHAIRLHQIEGFVAALGAHAGWEDATLYRYADEKLPDPMKLLLASALAF